jgi:hypothetical protein
VKDTAQRLEESVATYTVGELPVPAGDRPPTRYAIFLTHGMGQPLPFQTIDHVSRSLYEWDRALLPKDHPKNPEPNANTIKVGDDWLNRIELQLKYDNEVVEVHLYEGYWAPLTEGKISVRNVMAFLSGAGVNALRHTTGEFKRWMFGKYPPFPIPLVQVVYLLIALATVASLVVMNSTIAIVAAARALLGEKPGWLTDALFSDLTTIFNIVVTVMAAFGLSLWIAILARRFRWPLAIRTKWDWTTLELFGIALLVVNAAGLVIPFLLYAHVREITGEGAILTQLNVGVARFNDVFDGVLSVGALVSAGFVAGRWTGRILNAAKRSVEDRERSRWTTGRVEGAAVLAIWLLAIVAFIATVAIVDTYGAAAFAQRAVAWPLLIAASAYIRLLLVQYVGDVAIYVMPYKLDVFNDLRREIKLRVHKVAKAVYSLREYNKVIVVGHSLGSVIAYDVLNMLILEDKSIADAAVLKEEADRSAGATDQPEDDPDERKTDKPKAVFLDVVNRTPLFLTFGCPLDKTAFVFSVQPKGTSEAREALAGSVQPLIMDYKYRPAEWINYWSRRDIISGPLDLYDLAEDLGGPPEGKPPRVQNEVDPDATTLLVAHTQYWENPLLTRTIYNALEAL